MHASAKCTGHDILVSLKHHTYLKSTPHRFINRHFTSDSPSGKWDPKMRYKKQYKNNGVNIFIKHSGSMQNFDSFIADNKHKKRSQDVEEYRVDGGPWTPLESDPSRRRSQNRHNSQHPKQNEQQFMVPVKLFNMKNTLISWGVQFPAPLLPPSSLSRYLVMDFCRVTIWRV